MNPDKETFEAAIKEMRKAYKAGNGWIMAAETEDTAKSLGHVNEFLAHCVVQNVCELWPKAKEAAQ